VLAPLEDKYQTLAALRARRDAQQASGALHFGDDETAARGAVMRRLARGFPGALRELQRCSHQLLAARAEAIADVRKGSPAPPWIAVVLDYHAALREVLALKRGAIPPDGGFGWPRDPAALALVARPPGGRLVPLVWAELALRHGQPAATLEAMVFGLHTS
jgi:hypothetical protein